MSGFVGYDPARVNRLRTHTGVAIGALATIASADPAAHGAIAAVRRLRRVLDEVMMPSIVAVLETDPLGRVSGRLALATAAESKLAAWAAHEAWFEVRPYAGWSDDELLAELERLDFDLPLDDGLRPDLRHPMWADFELLAAELARRVAVDDDFAAALVERAPTNPLVALAVGAIPFSIDFVEDVAASMLRLTSWSDDAQTRYQAAGAEIVLRQLLAHPERCLALLGDGDVAFSIADWPLIDQDLAATVILTGLMAPDADPALLGHGQEALSTFVALANRRTFEEGFPAPVAEALAAAVPLYLPTFVRSLEVGDPVNLSGLDGLTTGERLGSYEEVLDFFGALLREPAAADLLLATLNAAAHRSLHADIEFNLHQVGDFALALDNAARNERLEEEMEAAAHRVLIQAATIAIGIGTGHVAVGLGVGHTSRKLIELLVSKTGDGAAGTVTADRLDISGSEPGATADAAEVMLELALFGTFLAAPGAHRDRAVPLDRGVLARARRELRQAEEQVRAGAPLGEVAATLENVQLMVVQLGGAAFIQPLHVGSIRALDRNDADADRG